MKLKILLFSLLFIAGASDHSVAWATAVAFPKAISTNVCADELLLEIADPNQILAITSSRKKRYEKVLKQNPHIEIHNGSTEEIISFNPDFILTGEFDAPMTSNLLEKFKIEKMILEVPKDFEEIVKQIDIVGRKLKRTDQSNKLIQRIKTLLKEESSSRNLRAVFWAYEGHIPGENTYEDALLNQLGLANIAKDFHVKGHGWISIEELIQASPDILFRTEGPHSKDAVGYAQSNHPLIKRALPHLKVITLQEDRLRCGGPDLINLLEELKSELHEK